MIKLIDYGLGNINAFANIYKKLGIPCQIAKTIDDLSLASSLILPGVGSFDWAMHRLDASGMRPALDALVMEQQVPVLGICVGMQMMANSSDEGHLQGLGWISGEVKRFDDKFLLSKASVPHMGWNDVTAKAHPLFAHITEARFYFLHSYRFLPVFDDCILAESEYGQNFASAIFKKNVMGVQFHPEKSHHWGIQLLKNFSEIAVH